MTTLQAQLTAGRWTRAERARPSGIPGIVAALTLPPPFACGMSALDTCDRPLMTRAYSRAFRSPARKLSYNIATTAMTVLVAAFIGSVYPAGFKRRHGGRA